MAVSPEPLAQGAEATITTGTWYGRNSVAKERLVKGYRHPVIDARLRDERTRDEANLLVAARRAGVRVPIVYDIDRTGATIQLEYISGRPLRIALAEGNDAQRAGWMTQLGEMIGLLHDAGLTHGDLTSSNVMVAEAGLVLIDFGLGEATQEDEPKAVDLHLLEEALEATQDDAAGLTEVFLAAYEKSKRSGPVMTRLEEVRERGRYRGAA